jgi:TatD DNase family protein
MARERSLYVPGSIDTHAHLTLLERKGLDPCHVLRDAEAGGLSGVLDVGITPSDIEERLRRYGPFAIVAFTVGLHPTSVTPETTDRELVCLEEMLAAAVPGTGDRIVAVGEMGLDFYHSTEHVGLQTEAFERQAAIAERHHLPLVIHNRASEREMLTVLRRTRPRGVMHCFSQDARYCRECLDLGLFVSFGGNITYRASDEIRSAAAMVPDDHLLVETDAPYLSPQAVRGTPNHPGHLGFTIGELARIRGTTPEHVAEVTAQNARALFGFSPPAAGSS